MDSLRSVVWFLLVGGIAGFRAGKIMRGHGYGPIGDVILGIFGGIVGGFLFALLGLGAYGLLGSLVMATVGSVVVIWLARKFRSA